MSETETKIEYTPEQLKAQIDELQAKLDVLTKAHNAHVTEGHVHSLTDGQIVKGD